MQKDYSQRGKANKTDDDDGLSIFGYSCKLFPHSEKADFVAEERHLQSWNGDGSLRLDRYDCRLLLTRIDDRVPENEEEACPTEEMEEEMCEEERYKDMYLDIQSMALKESEEKKKKAEVAFDYGTSTVGESSKEEEESDSEDEPFEPPPGIKLPVGLATPDNLKQSHIIERTAIFVVSKGPQMEIVIKAKQRNNSEQFGFLEFDNVLNPYYKYISKLIREKKYTPDFTKKKEKVEPVVQKKPANALAAIAAEHSDSDDSDSDCELHPSLFAVTKREPSPDIIDRTRNAAGPRQKPAETSPIRPNYDIKQSNDMYASLFKSLTGYTDPPVQEKPKVTVKEEVKQEVVEAIDHDVDIEWQQWWMQFYGSPAPGPAPKPMIPPPPDMGPIVLRYAEFVARHGAQAELSLVARPDLKLHFMDPNSPFFSYYQHRVRYAQWEMAQSQEAGTSQASTPQMESAAPTPETLNRKQRRRLQDAQKVGPAPPPGVVDPVALKTMEIASDIPKTQSCPANLGAIEAPVPEPPKKPYVATGGPVSFSLNKEESKVLTGKTVLGDEDDPLTAMVASPTGSLVDPDSAREAIDDLMSKAPEPPAIQNNQQLDRKEKARVFMEKLLKEKRTTKVREAEQARIRELEQQKMELEQELAEENRAEEAKKVDLNEKKMDMTAEKTLNLIDQMINSRIDNLLQSTGIALVQKSPEKKEEREEKERKRSRESKKHKHKRKRSRSRSRSRDREYRRRRSRSRSYERDSRRRRYH